MSKGLYWLFRKFPKEAEIIGRMVMGYGEMEYHLGWCVTHIIDDEDTAFKVIFRSPGEIGLVRLCDPLRWTGQVSADIRGQLIRSSRSRRRFSRGCDVV
jgi:hypothetical protein